MSKNEPYLPRIKINSIVIILIINEVFNQDIPHILLRDLDVYPPEKPFFPFSSPIKVAQKQKGSGDKTGGLYLHPGLRQFRPHGQLLPHINIWVVGFLEHFLQLLQLRAGERRPVSPLLAAGHVAVALVRHVVQVRLLRAARGRRRPQRATAVQRPAELRVQGVVVRFRDPVIG